MPFCRDCYVNVAAIVFTGDTQVTLKRVAPWLECRTRDQKVAGSSPGRSGRLIFFSRVNFMCELLFRYPFHPRVTAAVRKRFLSFCRKCRWQVAAKHSCTLCIWLCMTKRDVWCMVVRCTQNAPRRQQFHVAKITITTKQPCKYTTSVDVQNAL